MMTSNQVRWGVHLVSRDFRNDASNENRMNKHPELGFRKQRPFEEKAARLRADWHHLKRGSHGWRLSIMVTGRPPAAAETGGCRSRRAERERAFHMLHRVRASAATPEPAHRSARIALGEECRREKVGVISGAGR